MDAVLAIGILVHTEWNGVHGFSRVSVDHPLQFPSIVCVTDVLIYIVHPTLQRVNVSGRRVRSSEGGVNSVDTSRAMALSVHVLTLHHSLSPQNL